MSLLTSGLAAVSKKILRRPLCLAQVSSGTRLNCSTTSTKPKQPGTQGKMELVYEGQITKQVKRVKMFSVTTSILGASLQPWIFTAKAGAFVVKAAMFGTISFFVIVTPIVLNLITRRYVTRLYYDRENDKFEAVTLSLFVREKKVTFTSDDIETPDVTGPFTSLLVQGKPYFIDTKSIEDDAVALRLRGMHKPLKMD